MADYKGEVCAVCAEKFKDGDDIVVCPDCGTPYHRACWAKVGHCVHEAEHAAGFVWQPAARAAAQGDGGVVCPNCGAPNAPGAKQCSHCGVPLPAPEGEADPRPIYAREGDAYPNAAAPGPRTREPRMSAYAAGQDGGIYRRELGPDDTIDGIKARDWSRYVGASSPFYLMQFFRMSLTKRRFGACFSAFLFGPVYFFYRKMYAEGIRFALLLLALEVPSVLALLAGAGVAPVAGWNMSGWLPALTEVCYVASWAVRVLMGMFAVYWYKQSAARRIKAIYEQIPEGPDRAEALTFTGGTSLPAALVYLLAYFALAGALGTLAGPYLQTLLSNMML